MQPAPGVHISTAGCTIFGGVHPVCARFLSNLSFLYIGRVHGTISGCTVLGEVHPVSAQNKSLISDTVWLLNNSVNTHIFTLAVRVYFMIHPVPLQHPALRSQYVYNPAVTIACIKTTIPTKSNLWLGLSTTPSAR